MKTMTCKQLGGACDLEFHAETFEEMAALSRNHGLEMAKQGDEDHYEAMNTMQELMNTPEKIKEWMEAKEEEFDDLPEDDE